MNELYLNELLSGILILVIPVLAVYIIKVFATLTNNYKQEYDITETDVRWKYILLAEDIVVSVVMYVSQTFVDVMKRDNTFNYEAQQIAFSDAKKRILQLLSDPMQKAIEFMYGDIDTWIDTKIEASIREQNLEGVNNLYSKIED